MCLLFFPDLAGSTKVVLDVFAFGVLLYESCETILC
jgi:hypothetical protein